jgi:hypothetical protein
VGLRKYTSSKHRYRVKVEELHVGILTIRLQCIGYRV